MPRIPTLFALTLLLALASNAFAQTTAGTSATIVVPVIAQTSSFGSEVTLYNPNASAISVTPTFYDAQNTGAPGPKSCTALSIAANVTRQFTVAAQCALPAGSNFGLLVLAEATGTQRFYGYARTQTPQGVGFSTEGFPIENFNDQIQHATGLKRVAASGGLPAYQTNCFVATLGDAVNYELRLFDGGNNTQLGATLSGTLQPFQQFRYLDVFAAAGVTGGNKTNVRAQFSNLTGAKKKLIGFCTVQENTGLSADFRIAKSYGGTPQNALVQGGNAFGTTALIGTTDNQPFTALVGNAPALRLTSASDVDANVGVNVIGGFSANVIDAGAIGATIGGGGFKRHVDNALLGNHVAKSFGTIGGGTGNAVTDQSGTVAGGEANTAGLLATVGGGIANTASGVQATVVGGDGNTASGGNSVVLGGVGNTASGASAFAGGFLANANQDGCVLFAYWHPGSGGGADCFGTQYQFRVMGDHGLSIDYGTRLSGGNGTRWAVIGDTVPGKTIATWTNAYLSDGGTWVNASDRALKTDFQAIDPLRVLAKLDAMPVTRWRYKNQADELHLGPVAQDFYAAFGLGADDKHIATVDEAGVALAAIQGLHALLRERDEEIAALRERLSRIEATLSASQSARTAAGR
jgi:hypothetical protein